MEKHPFFMTKSPEEGQLSPLLEGIQQLKYDENENTPLGKIFIWFYYSKHKE